MQTSDFVKRVFWKATVATLTRSGGSGRMNRLVSQGSQSPNIEDVGL